MRRPPNRKLLALAAAMLVAAAGTSFSRTPPSADAAPLLAQLLGGH
jgi:hypothetical protein